MDLHEVVVRKQNLAVVAPVVVGYISQAAFISIDCEFSGVGNSRDIIASNIEERYAALKRLVECHSIIELGISIFIATEDAPPGPTHMAAPPPAASSPNDDNEEENSFHSAMPSAFAALADEEAEPLNVQPATTPKKITYNVHNFSFLIMSETDFMVTPRSATFLVKHGFDFNELYRDGILYTPKGAPVATNAFNRYRESPVHNSTPDKPKSPADTDPQESTTITSTSAMDTPLTKIWEKIVAVKPRIALHNGFLDLMFLYYSFQAKLPDTIYAFQAQAAEILPRLFDTKYIFENFLHDHPSFLEYAYKKMLRRNTKNLAKNKAAVALRTTADNSADFGENAHRFFAAPQPQGAASVDSPSKRGACKWFAKSGNCDRPNCPFSHSIDQVLDEEEANKANGKGKGKHSGGKRTGTAHSGKKRPRPQDSPASSSTPSSAQIAPEESIEPNAKRQKVAESPTVAAETSPAEHKPNFSKDSHGAGFDAFATAFLMSIFRIRSDFDENKWRGKLYLIGKEMPLLIVKSTYV